jgi:beige protein homolog 1
MSGRSTPLVESNGSFRKDFQILSKRQIGTKILELYVRILCEKGNLAIIRKFAKTVTNKVLDAQLPTRSSRLTMAQWLLYLLSEDDPEVVVYGCKILARVLVAHGSSYTAKFSGKTGGFYIMARRLKRWWDIPTIWAISFSILFGYDVAEIDFDKTFDFFSLIETFGKCKVVHPDALSIITSMFQHGLKDVLKNQDDPDFPYSGNDLPKAPEGPSQTPATRPRARSMSLRQELETRSELLDLSEDVSTGLD